MSVSRINKSEVVDLLKYVGKEMIANRDVFQELDARWGDGDLGNTTKRGFSAINEKIDEWSDLSLSEILKKVGTTFNRAAASTCGVFFATSFIEAAKEVKGKGAIDVATLCKAMKAATQGVVDRGDAEVGDKTLLDALAPSAEAVCEAKNQDLSLDTAVEKAERAAAKGVKNTEGMTPKQGRGSWLGEEAVKVQDPGAKFVHLFLLHCEEYINEPE